MTTSKDKIKTMEEKIRQGRAKFDKMEAALEDRKRKERNGQLIASGVLFQAAFKRFSKQTRQGWANVAQKEFGQNKNLYKRLIAMFEMLNEDFPAPDSDVKTPENKSEVPIQTSVSSD